MDLNKWYKHEAPCLDNNFQGLMCCLVHRDWGISIVVEMGWEQTAGWHNHKEKVTELAKGEEL